MANIKIYQVLNLGKNPLLTKGVILGIHLIDA